MVYLLYTDIEEDVLLYHKGNFIQKLIQKPTDRWTQKYCFNNMYIYIYMCTWYEEENIFYS